MINEEELTSKIDKDLNSDLDYLNEFPCNTRHNEILKFEDRSYVLTSYLGIMIYYDHNEKCLFVVNICKSDEYWELDDIENSLFCLDEEYLKLISKLKLYLEESFIKEYYTSSKELFNLKWK